MLDPFVYGRGGVGSTSAAIGFAPDERSNLPPDIALAYASILTKAPKPPTFEQRWTTWGSAFGGSNTANGVLAVMLLEPAAGSYGFASGMDYHVSPYARVGFAVELRERIAKRATAHAEQRKEIRRQSAAIVEVAVDAVGDALLVAIEAAAAQIGGKVQQYVGRRVGERAAKARRIDRCEAGELAGDTGGIEDVVGGLGAVAARRVENLAPLHVVDHSA